MVSAMDSERAGLEFPLDWQWRVVAARRDGVEADLAAVLKGQGYDAVPSEARSSSGGKYVSFHVSVRLADRDAMDRLAAALAAVEGVKFLL